MSFLIYLKKINKKEGEHDKGVMQESKQKCKRARGRRNVYSRETLNHESPLVPII